MPTISMFYGIIVRMYSEPDSPHHEPIFMWSMPVRKL